MGLDARHNNDDITMICEFENIGNNQHKCRNCGLVITSALSSDQISATCKAPSKERKTMPSTMDMIKNFGSSMANHAMNSFQSVLPNVKEERIKICESCEHYDSESKRCSECGCFVHIKAGWASEKCPLDKWGISTDGQMGGCGGCGKK